MGQLRPKETPSYFNFDSVSDFLFKNWNLNNAKDYAGACGCVFVLAVILEFLNYVKVCLQDKSNINPLNENRESLSSEGDLVPYDPDNIARALYFPVSLDTIRRTKIRIHIVSSLIHMIHLVLGWVVMLAVMSYNGYITIAVVVAAGMGFYVFGAMRFVVEARAMEKIIREGSTPRDSSSVST